MERIYQPEGQLLQTTRNRELTESIAGLRRAMETGAIIEGMALVCDKSFSLLVEFPLLPGVRGVIPREEVAWMRDGTPIRDIAILTRVGKPVACKVIDIRTLPANGTDRMTSETIVILSRKEAQKECVCCYLDGLRAGDIIRARVTHLENFGAFADIGCGVTSLLSVDSISVSRIAHPRDRLYNGQLLWAVVRQVDEAGRIFLSTRELLGTWEENASQFLPGQTVAGIVRSVEDYGVFVELAPNLAGLAELRDEDRALATSLVGRTATVFIKSIIPERMKIKLVLIDAWHGEPVPAGQMRYYITGEDAEHMDRWTYSPVGARKRVETIFSMDKI